MTGTEISILFIVLYAAFSLLVMLGWRHQIRKSALADTIETITMPGVSVIIPCRNEAQTIVQLLQRLEPSVKQTSVEVICVDDHSVDDTKAEIKKFEWVRYASLPDIAQGKKAAIEEGIRSASGDVILVTDADCLPDVHWLERMVRPFLSPAVNMVCGWVRMKGRGDWFSELVSLEFSTMVALGAAMNGWNKPVLCNGASVALRKESFWQVGGYSSDKSASGDDVFLLHKFKTQFGKQAVHYMLQPDAGVETKAPATRKCFVHQRIRWAKKSVLYKDADTVLLSLFLLGIHGWLVGWFVAAWFDLNYVKIFGYSWLGKSLCDVLWVATYARTLKQERWSRFVLPLCLIHWLYIPVMAWYAQLAPMPAWKGRIWKY